MSMSLFLMLWKSGLDSECSCQQHLIKKTALSGTLLSSGMWGRYGGTSWFRTLIIISEKEGKVWRNIHSFDIFVAKWSFNYFLHYDMFWIKHDCKHLWETTRHWSNMEWFWGRFPVKWYRSCRHLLSVSLFEGFSADVTALVLSRISLKRTRIFF